MDDERGGSDERGGLADLFALIPVPALSSDRALISWGQLGSNLLYVASTSGGPSPPPSGLGVQKAVCFLFVTDSVNCLSWAPSPTSNARYNIYRNGVLIGTTENLHFEDHHRVPGEKVFYSIRTVLDSGAESLPLLLSVDPLKKLSCCGD